MRTSFYRAAAILLLAGLAAGCSANRAADPGQPHELAVPSAASDGLVLRDNRTWIPVEYISKSLGMNLQQAGQKLIIGDTDPAYTLQLGQNEAAEGSRSVSLPQPPAMINGKPYLSAEAVAALMNGTLAGQEQAGQTAGSAAGQLPGQPTGPLRAEGLAAGQTPGQMREQSTGSQGSPTSGKFDTANLINFAKQFLGTPYQFGAGSYRSTRAFDCSSFMQYVYAHFGISIPRYSKDQAKVGVTVRNHNMQPGDLMFFYTPGRYASNRMVGHVGMYIGGNRFIQTYGKPGVIISDFNNYWRGRFLFAKRVVS